MGARKRFIRALRRADLWVRGGDDLRGWAELTLAMIDLRPADTQFLIAAWHKYGQGTPIPGYNLPRIQVGGLA